MAPSLVRRIAAWAIASAILTMLGAPGAGRADQAGPRYCRLDHAFWLGCPANASLAPGAECACPSVPADDARRLGQVQPSSDEQIFTITSNSKKVALGLSWLVGPVTFFMPDSLLETRGVRQTTEEQQIREIYDSVRGQSKAIPPQTAVPVTAAPAPRLTPARIFLGAADIPPAGVGAYGVVALKARPTGASRARLGMVCAAFLASLPAQRDLPPQIAVSQQMLTIWPVDNPDASAHGKPDCDTILDHYDLFGGQSAIADAEAQGQVLSGRGPFLIGWSPSNTRGVRDAVVLVIDLTEFDTQGSFDEAFLFWQHKIIEDPALWKSGFSVERLRLAARDFVDHYGSDILKALKISGN